MADDDDKTTNDETNEAEETEAEETEVSEDESEVSSDDSSDDDSSDDDPRTDQPEPPKSKTKKRTKKRASTETKKKKTRKKASPASARGPAPAPKEDEDDNGTMMALGAFVLAILAIGALWWWNSRDDDDEETASSEETVEPAEDEDAREPADLPSNLAEALGHPPPREAPPRPPQIPAPDDVAAAPENATTTESGLAYRVIEEGTGEDHPATIDRVTVHYTGWTTDGEMFDSSRTRGRPATFALNGVIAGWTEGVQLMVVGETTRFWIPQELAYGGRPGAPAGMLVFDVELVSFDVVPPPPPPPATPEDVAAVPSNATTTASGLAYRVLEAGTGTEHPTVNSRVSVHYTGWTTDGESFDSSVTRGRPASFGLGGVIAGWTEGVQLMVVGERTRFWIPEALAYGGRPGAPAGMLVFDVELLEILPAAPPRGRPGMPSGHP